MYMYILCIYIYTYTHRYTDIHTQIYTDIHRYTQIYTDIYTHRYIHMTHVNVEVEREKSTKRPSMVLHARFLKVYHTAVHVFAEGENKCAVCLAYGVSPKNKFHFVDSMLRHATSRAPSDCVYPLSDLFFQEITFPF